jgi:glycosyltransferase involved in cell wall biosynthesis
MPLQLGIGVITWRRPAVLAVTLDRIAQHTKYPFCHLVVADDGSGDETLALVQARGVRAVTGRNMGVAWNKNRALFLLFELLRCDLAILLEDDAAPERDNWEVEWMQAALRWGHVNVACPWVPQHQESGAGTLDDPVRSMLLSAQVQAFSREAVLFGGYYDTRFRGFGHGHREHSYRLARAGYGARLESAPDGGKQVLFYLIRGGIAFAQARSAADAAQAERNRRLAATLADDFGYRAPWRDEAEMRQFRDEMRLVRPRVL